MPTYTFFMAQNASKTAECLVQLKVVYIYGSGTWATGAYMTASAEVLTTVSADFTTNNASVHGRFVIPSGSTRSGTISFVEAQSVHDIRLGRPVPQKYLNQHYIV